MFARPICMNHFRIRSGSEIRNVFFEYRTGDASLWICLHVRRIDGGIGWFGGLQYGMTCGLPIKMYSYMRRRAFNGKERKTKFGCCGGIVFADYEYVLSVDAIVNDRKHDDLQGV